MSIDLERAFDDLVIFTGTDVPPNCKSARVLVRSTVFESRIRVQRRLIVACFVSTHIDTRSR
jgi:hypothetical protein